MSRKNEESGEEDKRALSLRLSGSLHAHLSAVAAVERRSLNAQIVLLLEEGVDRRGHRTTKSATQRRRKK